MWYTVSEADPYIHICAMSGLSCCTYPGYGVCQQGLAAARWAVQQQPPGRGHPQLSVNLRVFEVNQQLAHILQPKQGHGKVNK